ncbi:MAG: hypothetical protein OSB55_06100 [Verrucomicrobiota bacterium]|nr:hypothetical protein [Verrucomicrobiota bacterium]
MQHYRKTIGALAAASTLVVGLPMVRLILLLLVLTQPSLHAFPPAPYYTIHGDVRDQYGLLIPAGGSTVLGFQGGKEMMRQALTSVSGADYNYLIRMRMDMLRPSTAAYSSKAMTLGGVYTLAVEIGGEILYPIEMASRPSVGSPGARRRLDLTLGIDSDGDGLPDAWEESQLHHAEIRPGINGWDLSLIDRDGDFDKDGISNFNEYIAGTYASDASSALALKIKEQLGDFVRFEFYAIYGKSYILEASSDLQNWSAVSFSLAAPVSETLVESQSSLLSLTTGITSIYAGAPALTPYYRLTSR